jgi:hypothetical protein
MATICFLIFCFRNKSHWRIINSTIKIPEILTLKHDITVFPTEESWSLLSGFNDHSMSYLINHWIYSFKYLFTHVFTIIFVGHNSRPRTLYIDSVSVTELFPFVKFKQFLADILLANCVSNTTDDYLLDIFIISLDHKYRLMTKTHNSSMDFWPDLSGGNQSYKLTNIISFMWNLW